VNIVMGLLFRIPLGDFRVALQLVASQEGIIALGYSWLNAGSSDCTFNKKPVPGAI
jgi:hypothetical protein